jgi:predicted protein tyrosine phosphatase
METILFLCPHNAAKGILAEAYFNHRVKLEELPFQADSAGTDPDAQIWPSVVALLQREGIALTSKIPRGVTHEDLLHAFQVISKGCTESYQILWITDVLSGREATSENESGSGSPPVGPEARHSVWGTHLVSEPVSVPRSRASKQER